MSKAFLRGYWYSRKGSLSMVNDACVSVMFASFFAQLKKMSQNTPNTTPKQQDNDEDEFLKNLHCIQQLSDSELAKQLREIETFAHHLKVLQYDV